MAKTKQKGDKRANETAKSEVEGPTACKLRSEPVAAFEQTEFGTDFLREDLDCT
jgi:hypothetical protein